MHVLPFLFAFAAFPPPPGSCLRISEVHFAPSDANLEFVEIVNICAQAVVPTDLTLADARDHPSAVPPDHRSLQAGDLLVLVRDAESFEDAWPGVDPVPVSPWPALNNGSDAVILRSGEVLLDRIVYEGAWLDPRLTDPGRPSLERIDPASDRAGPAAWATATAASGATPGRPNDAGLRPRGRAPRPGDLRLTEVFYEPESGRLPVQPEFVEIGVVTTDPVDPNGLYLSIGVPGGRTDSVRIGFGPDALLRDEAAVAVWPPSGHLLPDVAVDLFLGFPASVGRLPPDRVWPASGGSGLRNDGALLVLRAPDGTELDRLDYGDHLHHPAIDPTAGLSIERIDWDGPSDTDTNWTTAVHPDGATPGYHTIRPGAPDAGAGGLVVDPPVITPGSDTGLRQATVHVSFFDGTSILDVRVFDLEGRTVRTLANGRPSTGPDAVYWNGLDDRGLPVPTGPYIVLAAAWSTDGGHRSARQTVVVAR